jgi:hypothetical protein
LAVRISPAPPSKPLSLLSFPSHRQVAHKLADFSAVRPDCYYHKRTERHPSPSLLWCPQPPFVSVHPTWFGCTHLRAAGASVRIASRHPDRARTQFGNSDPKLEAIEADVHSEASVASAVADAYGVVNVVSLYVERGTETFDSVHVRAAGALHGARGPLAMACRPKFSAAKPQGYHARPACNGSRPSKSSNSNRVKDRRLASSAAVGPELKDD